VVKKAQKTRISVWAVKVSYHYGEESYRDELETDVKLFANFNDAVKELERIIRDDWTAEVEGDDYMHPKSLADMRGHASDEDSIKYSHWYYSEDGTTAWAFYDDRYGYKGEVVQLPVNGMWRET
jgi:hypothetical protein